MKIVYEGKTKTVYANPDGSLTLLFKDDVTGENGKIDPGSNEVLGRVAGKGQASLRLSQYFFDYLKINDIRTHFISASPANNTMTVRKAKPFGNGLEFICRLRAYGSFLKRYGFYVREELQKLDYLCEITLKDDSLGDPLINDETLLALNIMSSAELEEAKKLTRSAAKLVAGKLENKNLELIDVKFEFGLIDSRVAVIDEISGDNMRVRDNNGHFLDQKELCRLMLDNA